MADEKYAIYIYVFLGTVHQAMYKTLDLQLVEIFELLHLVMALEKAERTFSRLHRSTTFLCLHASLILLNKY